MRLVAWTILIACLAGCSSVQPADLLGRDEAYVVKTLGKPESRGEITMPPADQPRMGPMPRQLAPGEHFVSLRYEFAGRNEQWFVILASPAAFERMHGTKPYSGQSDCVIEIQKYPKGAVF